MPLSQATVTFTPNQLGELLAALDELPGKIGRPLHQMINDQVANQVRQFEAAEKEALDKDKKELEEFRQQREAQKEAKPNGKDLHK